MKIGSRYWSLVLKWEQLFWRLSRWANLPVQDQIRPDLQPLHKRTVHHTCICKRYRINNNYNKIRTPDCIIEEKIKEPNFYCFFILYLRIIIFERINLPRNSFNFKGRRFHWTFWSFFIADFDNNLEIISFFENFQTKKKLIFKA